MRHTSWILCLAFTLHLAGWFLVIPASAPADTQTPPPISSCHQTSNTPPPPSPATNCLFHCLSQDYQNPPQADVLLHLFQRTSIFSVVFHHAFLPLLDPLFTDAVPPPLSTLSRHLAIQKRE
ncbi:TPA: hypothetical protein DEP34_02960 [Candidatus Uhrbacteria bacterium]|nr:hypothetical protein [Candidatus Uhrbacteria bacterium]HCB19323.1 hypothetical protein [Candidatus Uhrbacteria bacterium]